MQAVILAGGLGTRLRLVVDDRPKVMANVSGKPFLEYQVEHLEQNGIDEFVFCVGYLHDHVMEYFGDGSRLGIKIDYSVEKELLGTAGALKHAEKLIDGVFLVLNGDSFLDCDFPGFIEFHELKKHSKEQSPYLGTIALTQVKDTSRYGSIRMAGDGLIEDFVEKSTKSTPRSNDENFINAGVYIFEPRILSFIAGSQPVSLEKDLFPQLLEKGYRFGGYSTQGLFVDIGTPNDYFQFQEYIEARNS